MSGRAATTNVIPGKYAVSVGDADMPTPPGWQWCLLTDIARLETGHTPSRNHDEYWNGGIPWIGIKDARRHHGGVIQETIQHVSQLGLDNSAARLLPAGTVCLSRTASIGYALMMGQEMATSQDFVNWVCSQALVPKYLMYALIAEGDGLRDFGKGTTHTTIYFPEVKAFHVCVPPRKEQIRIVTKIEECFSDLDAGVKALNRVQTNLKRYRASVLKAAVEGKLTEAWRADHPQKETGKELLERILKERRQKWEADQLADYEAKVKHPPKNWKARYKEPVAPDTSELPNLPEGWSWATLDQLITNIEAGKSFKCESRKATLDEWGVIKVSAMTWGTFLEEEQKAIPSHVEFDSHWEVKPGDILLSRSNTTELVGASVLVGECRPRLLLSDKSLRLLTVNCVDRRWFHCLLSSTVVRKQISSLATGTSNSMRNVSQEKLKAIVVPVPPCVEQIEIALSVDAISTIEAQTEEEISKGLLRAARLRQSILKDAFEGRLVDQDSADESASKLIARIKAKQESGDSQPKTRCDTPRVPRKITQRRGAIIAYTIAHANSHAARKSETLGRTKLIKTLYLAQTHEELDLQFRFQRYAAGPFDEALYKLEGTAKNNNWFSTKDREKYGVTYHPDTNTESMCEEAADFLGDQKNNIDQLLGHFAKMDMREAELFATAYAAWNDLLIDGREVTDKAIIEEFYGWDEKKKEFSRAAILKQLKWMRSEGYVPTGKGERTQPRNKKTKLPSRQKGSRNE
tara:strand:- start:9708 stop:11945 length:2238 start_codon:yes stop_codon:yes gene_type:complete